MKPRMSMITLGVSDLRRSIEFYEIGLGFPRHGDHEEVAFFSLTGTWLGLYGKDALADDAGIDPRSSGFAGFAIAHNVSSEDEVDTVIRLAVQAGAKLVKSARKAVWGGYSGYFSDPDGYLWEIAHNPFMQVGPQDAQG
jgi:uncharacterized protein